jgi:hypothetical protein
VKFFSADDAVRIRHFAWTLTVVCPLVALVMGWLVREALSLHDSALTVATKTEAIDKRVDELKARGDKMQETVESVRDTALSAVRDRLTRAEGKLDCVSCAPAPLVSVSTKLQRHD